MRRDEKWPRFMYSETGLDNWIGGGGFYTACLMYCGESTLGRRVDR
jgi:hypothetical protein